MKKYIILLGLLNIIYLSTYSQEYLTGISVNPVLINKAKTNPHFKVRKIIIPTPVNLPFFDDFTGNDVYPDTSIWIDNEAYINTDFPVYPVNIGVATLDVINSEGKVYPEASPFPFIADHLTSKPIRLDSVFSPVAKAISPEDSVFFSFFYQPQGRGLAPETEDSLLLEFGFYGDTVFSYVDSILCSIYDLTFSRPLDSLIINNDSLLLPCDLPNDSIWILLTDVIIGNTIPDSIMLPCDSIFIPETEWKTVWCVKGDSLEVFHNKYNTYFRQVIIPITDSSYFTKNFQFRFKNYASISDIPSWKSNVDQWNIDYVYLNIDRSQGDTIYKEITFIEKPPSFLSKPILRLWFVV